MHLISIFLAKIISNVINLLKIGSGNTWPGHIALKMYPKIWTKVASEFPKDVVMISGTNGKTTTSKLLTHILENSGKKVLHNSSGANLLNGILSTALINSSFSGRLNYDVAVLEVDEFTLPSLMQNIKPSALALLNISRDQLDRHWETDLVYLRWEEALLSTGASTQLFLDAYQPEFTVLKNKYKGDVTIFDNDKAGLSATALLGEFNAKNVNCALSIAHFLGISKESALSSLKEFKYAFGRGEIVTYKEKEYRVLLAKNPESLNQNLKMLSEGSLDYDSLVYVLNDKVPDGHDVSWIYDIDPALILKASEGKNVFVSGVRALDMGIRLKYAGVDFSEENVVEDLPELFSKISSQDACKNILVLPNYSAMLESRKVLVGRRIL